MKKLTFLCLTFWIVQKDQCVVSLNLPPLHTEGGRYHLDHKTSVKDIFVYLNLEVLDFHSKRIIS